MRELVAVPDSNSVFYCNDSLLLFPAMVCVVLYVSLPIVVLPQFFLRIEVYMARVGIYRYLFPLHVLRNWFFPIMLH